jgi:hypothetical protein
MRANSPGPPTSRRSTRRPVQNADLLDGGDPSGELPVLDRQLPDLVGGGDQGCKSFLIRRCRSLGHSGRKSETTLGIACLQDPRMRVATPDAQQINRSVLARQTVEPSAARGAV